MFFPFDSTIILLLPAFIFSIYAQFKVKSTFKKMSQMRSAAGVTGRQVAEKLLALNGLSNIAVEPVQGSLTDHYDSRSKKIRLSEDVYNSTSLAAIGVAAHETGHAIQHAQQYTPLNIRQAIFPLASFGSQWGIWIFFIGFIFSSNPLMMDIGIFLFAGAVIFQIVTLPVEFNASSRALAQLQNNGLLRTQEIGGARKVLNAAALTYVAAAAMSILTLLRLLILRGDE